MFRRAVEETCNSPARILESLQDLTGHIFMKHEI